MSAVRNPPFFRRQGYTYVPPTHLFGSRLSHSRDHYNLQLGMGGGRREGGMPKPKKKEGGGRGVTPPLLFPSSLSCTTSCLFFSFSDGDTHFPIHFVPLSSLLPSQCKK